MKFLKHFLILALITVSISAVSAQVKIGYVNSQDLLAELPEVKQAQANLKSLEQQLQKKGQGMLESLQKKYVELQRKQEQGLMAPKDIEAQAQKLKGEEAKLEQYKQDMQDQLFKKQQELMEPVINKIKAAIKEVAKENGYTYILDNSAGMVLYGDPAYDVSALVKAKL